MKRPFFSIVTISLNQSLYLRQCLDSVIGQKDDDVEYIVVDPGSTDGSREILERYSDAIDHLVFEPDEGPADGLNRGFARARGEIGYFINSDDFLLPFSIARMRRLWSESPGTDILLGGAWMVDGMGKPIRELRATATTLESLLDGRTSMVQQGMSFRLDVFRRLGGFQQANRTCWDYELLCGMLYAGAQLRTTSERLGAFRFYEASLSGGVGGATHTQRYLADLERIRITLTGKRHPAQPLAPALLRRLLRQAAHPGPGIGRLRDWLIPAAMRRRWSRDMFRPG